jgi:hypothetical protein
MLESALTATNQRLYQNYWNVGVKLYRDDTHSQRKVTIMNYRTVLALALLSLTSATQAASLCGEKEADIQREIGYAEKHHNQQRIDGLNKALKELRANCSDSSLRADRHKKITKQKEEIAERKAELQEARQKGDADKISKREEKLTEAEHELKALEARDY